MRRRMSRQDLLESGAPFREEGRASAFRWRVYENYQLVKLKTRHTYFMATGSEIGDAYEPITDVPYLFLEFARLEEQRDRGELQEQVRNVRYRLVGVPDRKSVV